MRGLHLSLAAAAGLAACATQLVEGNVELEHVTARWLPAIADGVTTAAEVEQALGAPTRTFELGQVRGWLLVLVESADEPAYADFRRQHHEVICASGATHSERRARIDKDGRLATVSADALAQRELWPTLREAEFHLVIAVTPDGTIARHTLRRVLP